MFLKLLAIAIFSHSAHAALPFGGFDNLTYQIGSEWGKYPVTTSSLQSSNKVFQRAAFATLRVSSATGFYLGKFNGQHVVATNHHVCSVGAACLGSNVTFEVLGRSYKLDQWLGTFPNIDLTLMTIKVPAADESIIAPYAANFSFNKDVSLGQKLLTIGFGIGSNPSQRMVANQDNDCVVLSRTGEYRFMRDPDELNPGPDQVWSFANGCDVSHGDSGSAMVDRLTGEVVGIIWTGRVPKNPKIQNSAYVQSLLKTPNDDIWTQMSYAVPAKKMGEIIRNYAENTSWLTSDVKTTLFKIIGR